MGGRCNFKKRFEFMKSHSFFKHNAIVVTGFGGHMLEEDARYFKKWKAYMESVKRTIQKVV